MSSDHLEFTTKQQQLLRAGFPNRPSDVAPRSIIAHGATGAGKRLAVLAGLISWATTTRRRNDFLIVVPSPDGIHSLKGNIVAIAKTFGGFGGLSIEDSEQWVRVESNYFHFYPYALYFDDHTSYLGTIGFWNIIPRGVAFLAADGYSQAFVEHVISQIAEGPAMIWAAVDAGDSDNFWYTDYILKANGREVLAVHFDLQDVSENPGVSDRWREYMLTRARSDEETREFKSYVTGHWIPDSDSILDGLGEGERAQQDIDAQLLHRQRVGRARDVLIDATPQLIGRLEQLHFDAIMTRQLPYPYIGYVEGEELVAKLKETLSSPRREIREAASDLIESAAASAADDQ